MCGGAGLGEGSWGPQCVYSLSLGRWILRDNLLSVCYRGKILPESGSVLMGAAIPEYWTTIQSCHKTVY